MTLTEMIEKDILYCDTLIEKNYASSDDVLCLVSKYKKIDNKFGNERHNYVRTVGDNINEIKNIKILKNELESLLVLNTQNTKSSNESINKVENNYYNNNYNYNSNQNTQNIIYKIENIIQDIKNDETLNNTEKEEILEKLNEIKNISDSKEPKETKWTRCKVILNFLLDKGADFVITYLPQIIMYCKIFLNK